MEYTQLGNSGIRVSRLCLGCMSFGDPASNMHAWTLDPDRSAEIIARAEKSAAKEFILCTEPGVLAELSRRCPGKVFYPVTPVCSDMKRITPEKVLACLQGGGYAVELDAALMDAARRPLERMLELAR